MKITFLFSGQGSQYIGMGKEFYRFNICRRTFEEASDILGLDMQALCFEQNDKLQNTAYCQPALLTVSVAAARLMKEELVIPHLVMGISLGEYSALTVGGAFEFADCLRLVQKRGQFMSEASQTGSMTAVMGLSKEVLENLCEDASDQGYVACANYNTQDQIVIAGETAAVEKCEQLIKTQNGRCIRLKVSGPFHTRLLKEASLKFREELKKVTIQKPKVPVISNVHAELFDTSQYVDLLERQMISPVRWVDSVNKAISMGTEAFIELGAGKTLTSFVKKINKNVPAYTIETLKQLQEAPF